MIDGKLEQKIRDVEIRTSWAVLSTWTKMSYKEKINVLMKEYFLGFKRIEDIIGGR